MWEGDPAKYGDKIETNWHRYIALKYCCPEHAAITTAQSRYNSNKRRRRERREERGTLTDLLMGYREETKQLRERIQLQDELITGLRGQVEEMRGGA